MRFKILKAFTLIETLIAIAVLAILAAIMAGGLSSFQQSGELARAADMIAGTLRDARGRTLASKNNARYGIHFDSDKAVLFAGTVYTAGTPSNEAAILPSRIEISAIALGGGGDDVVFQRLSGEAMATGTITLRVKQESSKTREVQIYQSGVVEIK